MLDCERMLLGRRLSLGAAVPALLALSALVAGGCGDIDGAQPFAGMVRYQDPSGQYEVRMLEPPWIPLPIPGQTVFAVPASTVNAASALTDALYSLQISGADVDARSALTTAAAAAVPPWNLTRQHPVQTAAGAAGAEMSWQESPQLFHREVFVGSVPTRSFHLQFLAKRDIGEDAMITQMILSFAPQGTAAGTGVGH